MPTFHTFVESPLGSLLVFSDGQSVTGLYMNERVVPLDSIENAEAIPFAEVRRQLGEYFAGGRRDFDFPLAPRGTAFQQRVWRQLRTIPYGETISYGELAKRIDSPNASRAVGLANGQNPISIVVPCHRVIGANGKLTGYGGGLPNKAYLLDLEKGSLFTNGSE